MTKLLDKALETVRGLPQARQGEIARAMLSLARMDEGEAEETDPDHPPDVLEGLAEVRRGEFATDEEVAAAFRSFKQ